MTDIKEEWIQVGTALGLVLGGVPSKKTEKISNFYNFLKMSFFRILTYFSSKIYYFGILLGR